MAPRQLCSKLLHNWLVCPGLRERPHVFETSGAKALDPVNSFWRSCASRSMTLVPHRSASWRTRISRPTDQYKSTR